MIIGKIKIGNSRPNHTSYVEVSKSLYEDMNGIYEPARYSYGDRKRYARKSPRGEQFYIVYKEYMYQPTGWYLYAHDTNINFYRTYYNPSTGQEVPYDGWIVLSERPILTDLPADMTVKILDGQG